MLVFSSALVTESSASSGSPCHCRAYRSSTRAALASKSGARGKIQLRWDQGRIASSASQRQMVVPEIAATRPRVMTSSRMSGTCRRESGRPRRLGSSQAIALTSMTTSGGKDAWPSSPGSLLEAAEPLGEEAFAPLGDDLAAGVQTGPDLVVVEARSRHEHDLGPYDIPIRQRVPAGLGFQHLAFLVAQLDDVWAFPGHRSPSLERYTLVELGSLRCRTSVAMYLAWVLTLASGFAALRHVGFGLLFAYRVAGCRGGGATLGAAGTGPGGFRRTGRRAQHAADATIATPDAARGEPIGRQGPLPGAAQVPGQRPGEAELGVGDGDQPGPPVGLLGAAQAGPGQAKGLLEEPEGVLNVESSEEDPPQPIDVDRGGVGVAVPQPQRLGIAVARQTLDPKVHQRALHDRELAVVVGPRRAPFQLGVQPPPAAGHGLAEAVVGAGRGLCRHGVGDRVAKAEHCPWRGGRPGWPPRRRPARPYTTRSARTRPSRRTGISPSSHDRRTTS